MPIDIAIIPVAGHGTRLLPSTKSQPKEMLPVGRKPVVQYVVEELALSGIRRSMFVTGPGKQSIENHFDINPELISYLRESGREKQLEDLGYERAEMDYAYTRQRRQLGLGHAVLCARSFVGNQPFVVALGDSIIGLHAQSNIVRRMITEYEASEDVQAVVAFEEVPREETFRYGIAQPADSSQQDGVFELADLIEKPTVKEAPSNLAVAARYVFSPAIFDALEKTEPGKGGEIQLTDAIRQVLKSGARGVGVRLQPGEPRFDIGNFQSYFETFVTFALSDPHYGPALHGFVRRLVNQDSPGD